jgi:hypothetical protein
MSIEQTGILGDELIKVLGSVSAPVGCYQDHPRTRDRLVVEVRGSVKVGDMTDGGCHLTPRTFD